MYNVSHHQTHVRIQAYQVTYNIYRQTGLYSVLIPCWYYYSNPDLVLNRVDPPFETLKPLDVVFMGSAFGVSSASFSASTGFDAGGEEAGGFESEDSLFACASFPVGCVVFAGDDAASDFEDPHPICSVSFELLIKSPLPRGQTLIFLWNS